MLAAGDIVDGKYRITRVLGEGGMGVVYEGEHTRIRRRVAIKVLLPDMAANPEMVQRFEREAQVASAVGNDHILEVFDFGVLESGEHFIVMEYLDGENLDDRLANLGRLREAAAVRILQEVLDGLGAAHAGGVIHRDLKPENIFLVRKKDGRDTVKIIDFGISKIREKDGNVKVTRTGVMMGTPQYMAPEQASGRGVVDERSDLYAAGIILYECVTGQSAFEGDNFNSLMFEIALANVVPPRQHVPDLDPGVESIILRATARDPDRRFQSAEQFIAALSAWEREGTGVSAPPEESLEDIVSAAVPRASALPSFELIDITDTVVAGSSDTIPAPPSGAPETQTTRKPPTIAAWGKTGGDAAFVSPRNRPLLIAGIAGGLLAVGGVMFTLIGTSDQTEVATAVDAPPSASSGAVTEPHAPAVEVTPEPAAPSAPSEPPALTEEDAIEIDLGDDVPPASAGPSAPRRPRRLKATTGATAATQTEGKPATSPAPPATEKRRRVNFGY